jgi:hypothetical protein
MLPLTLADAGTPMILVGFAQLTIGNLFIGIIESLLVRKVFKVETAAAFLWIILANYLSCVAGIFFLGFVTNPIVHLIGSPVPIYALGRIAIVLAGLTFIITILVEWPFYWLGIRRKRPGAKTTFRANLVANAVTYSILAIFYWGIAQGPADWGFQLCPASLIAPNPQARILYLSPDGKEVIQLRIGNWTPTPVASLPPPNRALALMPLARSDHWQLVVADDPGAEHPGSPVVEIAGYDAAVLFRWNAAGSMGLVRRSICRRSSGPQIPALDGLLRAWHLRRAGCARQHNRPVALCPCPRDADFAVVSEPRGAAAARSTGLRPWRPDHGGRSGPEPHRRCRARP